KFPAGKTNFQPEKQISSRKNKFPAGKTNFQPEKQISSRKNKFPAGKTNFQPEKQISSRKNKFPAGSSPTSANFPAAAGERLFDKGRILKLCGIPKECQRRNRILY